MGKVRDVATGTYAYYGRIVRSGSVGTGGGGTDGSGGGYSDVPAPPGTPAETNDTNTTTGDSTNGYGSGETVA